MYAFCASLKSVHNLYLTTLSTGTCYQMFAKCYALEEAPELPVTILSGSCYQQMFFDCIKLRKIKVNFTEWLPTNATQSWVQNISPSGEFICPSTLPEVRGNNNIPNNWTITRF